MNPTKEHELHRLASAVCGGTATDGELRDLQELLEGDQTAQEIYVGYLEMHNALADILSEQPQTELASRSRRRAPSSGRTLGSGKWARYREALAWGVAVAACVLLLFAYSGRDVDKKQPMLAKIEEPGGLAAIELGPIRIGPGTMEVKLPKVGTMVVDGPAEMEWLSPKHLKLDSGKIKMHVTEKAGYGLLVTTPHGVVKDLGTEFGLDATQMEATNLVVFNGEVDLSMPRMSDIPLVQRLKQGDGVRFSGNGKYDRLMSIITRKVGTFSAPESIGDDSLPTIVNVTDDLSTSSTKHYFEIVAGGFGEDMRAYVDRIYEWNGMNHQGLPDFLLGADYVKTFNDCKQQDFEINVEVSRPCQLYVLWDERVQYTEWLTADYERMEYLVGLDESHRPDKAGLRDTTLGVGPGESITNTFSVWRREVKEPGTIVMGSLESTTDHCNLYGIVAVPLPQGRPELGTSHTQVIPLAVLP
ncbi:FecR domain-containing protein [Aeoliella sp. SH292]|uniref:FecR domain-containing protein n=1 Tax=Aeoliella sp. SH292 TaxID=3454464 RepID=UPI003F9BAF01